MLTLAGDIGGTKTLLQLAAITDGGHQVLAEQRYRSLDYPDLGSMVREFLTAAGESGVGRACFAVAGPVRNQRCSVTWLPWELDAQQLAQELSIPRVELINDFAGVGYGIAALQADDLLTLQPGSPEPHGTRAVLGAGTGLGGGILTWQQDHYHMIASEIGHADFAPHDDTGIELMRYLLGRHPRVSNEEVISGKGIVQILAFLQHHTGTRPGRELQQAMDHGDAAAAISRFALEQKDELAVGTMELFVQHYGAQAGNLALTCKASGGLYIAGGIAPKIIELINTPAFIEAFNNKPPMQELLESTPLHVVLNEKVGLLGAMVRAVTGYR